MTDFFNQHFVSTYEMSKNLQKEYIKKVQEHQGLINKILFLYADDTEDRKDLRQEILAEAWKSYPKFEGRSKFSSWLYRIGLNVAFARLRKKEKHDHVTLENSTLEGEDPSQMTNMELLTAILNVLQPIEKSIVLFLVEGYEQQEIAEMLGLSYGNVRVKINRLRLKLENYGFQNIA